MPITSTQLTQGMSTNASTVFLTDTYTPSSGQLILASIFSVENLPVSIEGNGATWVQVVGTVDPQVLVFRAMSTGALLSGASTIRTGGIVGTAPFAWSLVQFGGVSTESTDGTGAVVAATTVGGSTVNVITLSMAPFGAPGNVAYGSFAQLSSIVWTTGSGFDALFSTAKETAVARLSVLVERDLNDTSIDATGNTTVSKAAIGIEIKESTVSEQRFRRLMVNVGR